MLAFLKALTVATNRSLADVSGLFFGWKAGDIGHTAEWEEMIKNLKMDLVQNRLKNRKRIREDEF